MEYVQLLAAFIISLVGTSLAVPPVRRLAFARGWVDEPDGDRKMHKEAMVSVGGIAILVGVLVGSIYLIAVSNLLPFDLAVPSPFAMVGAGIIVAMGLIDDIRGLTFRSKFVIQIVAAYLLVMGGLRLDLVTAFVPDMDPELAFFLTFPITMLWIVGIVNAVNLVDGLDGLAAGLTAIAMASFALVFAVGGQLGLVIIALPVIGALTGFLTHNFNPASIFMGNSGSYFLGYVLAVVSIQSPTHGDPIVSVMIVLVILGLPVLDTTYAFLRRYLNGVSPFTADRDHVHHRLVRLYSHRTAVVIMYAVGAILGTAGVVMASSPSLLAMWVFAGMVVAGVACLGILGYVPFAVRRSIRPREHSQLAGGVHSGSSNGHSSAPQPRRFVRRIRSLESSSQA